MERNWDNTTFTDRIRISPKQKHRIIMSKGKLSQAGKLDEIIDFYFDHKNK